MKVKKFSKKLSESEKFFTKFTYSDLKVKIFRGEGETEKFFTKSKSNSKFSRLRRPYKAESCHPRHKNKSEKKYKIFNENEINRKWKCFTKFSIFSFLTSKNIYKYKVSVSVSIFNFNNQLKILRLDKYKTYIKTIFS